MFKKKKACELAGAEVAVVKEAWIPAFTKKFGSRGDNIIHELYHEPAYLTTTEHFSEDEEVDVDIPIKSIIEEQVAGSTIITNCVS